MLKLNFPRQITKATHICFALMCVCCQGRPTTLPAQRLARNRIAKRNCAQQRCLGPQSPDALIRLYARRLPVCVCVERWAAQRFLLSLLGITAKPDVRLRAGPRKPMSYRAARINNESAV